MRSTCSTLKLGIRLIPLRFFSSFSHKITTQCSRRSFAHTAWDYEDFRFNGEKFKKEEKKGNFDKVVSQHNKRKMRRGREGRRRQKSTWGKKILWSFSHWAAEIVSSKLSWVLFENSNTQQNLLFFRFWNWNCETQILTFAQTAAYLSFL